MNFKALTSLLIATLLVLSSNSSAQFDSGQTSFNPAQQEFLAVEDAYRVQVEQFNNSVLIRWQNAPNYYLYRHMFGARVHQQNQTTPVELNLPDGIRKYDPIFEKELEVYYGTTDIQISGITLSEGAILSLDYQGCADAGLCYPPETRHFSLNDGLFTRISEPQPQMPSTTETPSEFSWWLIIPAILGGLILNAMPCVFPVIALKATSFIAAGQHAKSHALAYTAGVISCFVALALVIITLNQLGNNVGWGFHLQSPIMIAMLCYLFTAMACILALDLPIAQSIMGLGSELQQGSSKRASFFTGLLAVVVASPCTAPFMGVAMGAALTQSPMATLLIFAAIGFGLALPILILSLWPALISRLPKPGPWMVTVRELMLFPLLATVIYLLWVIGHQAGVNAIAFISLGSLLIGFAAWCYGKQSRTGKISALIAAVLALVISGTISIKEKQSDAGDWLVYSPQALEQAASKGPVFVDVTAAWCITCIANRSAIESDQVTELVNAKNITLIEADWTTPDPIISNYLASFNRAGVPLYVYYPNGLDSAIVLPQLLTPDTISSYLQDQQ